MLFHDVPGEVPFEFKPDIRVLCQVTLTPLVAGEGPEKAGGSFQRRPSLRVPMEPLLFFFGDCDLSSSETPGGG